jgi:hypothetical protein
MAVGNCRSSSNFWAFISQACFIILKINLFYDTNESSKWKMMSYQSTTPFWLLLACQINKEFLLIEFSWKWWEYFRIFWVDASSQRLSSIPLASCSMPLQNIKGSTASLAIRLFFYFSPNTGAIPQSILFIYLLWFSVMLIRHHDIK